MLYAPAKGSTEKVAQKIEQEFGAENIDMMLIDENLSPKILENYESIIFGISTVGRDNWDNSYTKIGWDFFLPKLDTFNFSEKTVAIFGLGNHITYPDHFVDSMGLLAKKVIEKGGKLVGKCPVEYYEFNESLAVVDNEFLGLPVDEDNDYDQTDENVKQWVKLIKPELL